MLPNDEYLSSEQPSRSIIHQKLNMAGPAKNISSLDQRIKKLEKSIEEKNQRVTQITTRGGKAARNKKDEKDRLEKELGNLDGQLKKLQAGKFIPD